MLNHATIIFGSFDPIPLHVPPKTLGACTSTIQCELPKSKQTQMSHEDTIIHFCFDNESMSYNKECWTLVTWRRPHKKQESHSCLNLPRNEQHKQNIRLYLKKKEEKKPKRKQEIVQVDDLLVQKLITPITLEEYFSLEFFDRGMMTSTHIVSCHETSKEDGPSEDEKDVLGAELSKTKEEDEGGNNKPIVLTLAL